MAVEKDSNTRREEFNSQFLKVCKQTVFESGSILGTQYPEADALVDFGEEAIPWLLDSLKSRNYMTTHPSIDLIYAIAKENAPEIPVEERGKIKPITNRLLHWGVEKGLLEKEEAQILNP